MESVELCMCVHLCVWSCFSLLSLLTTTMHWSKFSTFALWNGQKWLVGNTHSRNITIWHMYIHTQLSRSPGLCLWDDRELTLCLNLPFGDWNMFVVVLLLYQLCWVWYLKQGGEVSMILKKAKKCGKRPTFSLMHQPQTNAMFPEIFVFFKSKLTVKK